jgi:DNA-binding winged helix-turn-helix (wHTH) protein
MGATSTSVFTFDHFRLDPAQRLLSQDGQPLALTPKEFDTLVVLVEAGGRVVDKEELLARIWPDSYVGDGSLARNISVLRKALGEDVIETHRGRGYRIAPPIVTLSSTESASRPDHRRTSREAADVVSAGKTAPRTLTRPVAMVCTVTAAALFVFFAFHVITVRTAKAHPTIRSILFEQSGGIDPLDAGFKLARPDEGYRHLMRNLDNTGFDRWRVITDDLNFYYRKLTDAEKEFALQRDWKLSCVCALEKGAGSSDIDLGPGIGPRFDIAYLQEGAKYFVVLTTQISPHYEFDQKIEFPGLADVDHPHTYELRYDHLTQTASLWIDGQLKASGYRGHRQYQENYGLMFGAATYRDAKQSSMVFRSVRFEVQ